MQGRKGDGMVLVRIMVVFLGVLCTTIAAAERPNVLLITVDTFRPDHLSGYGYERPTSPYLDSLAADGVLFTQAISSSSWTTPGLLSVLTGLYAPSHGVDVRGKSLQPGTATMATLLREAGYAVPDILYLSAIPNYYNLGLTNSYADRDTHLPNGDEVLFRALEAYRDSTFFLYYHYRNLHLPYKPSPPYDKLYTPEGFDQSAFVRDKVNTVQENVTIPKGTVRFDEADQAWIYGLYDGQIRQMDEELFKPLIAHLKVLGLYEKTLVIVTADHGEELLEHGFIGHPSTSFKGIAYDEVIRIPLMMTGPMVLPKGQVVDQQVQNVDILPTVLALLKLPIPEAVQGRSLVGLIHRDDDEALPAFTETTPGGYQATQEMMKTRIRAMRTSEWKLIHTHGPGVDVYELYNLQADPTERHNVVDDYADVVAPMRTALHQWVLRTQPRVSVEPAEITQSEIVLNEPLRVLFPADGDTFRYVDVGKTVSVRWTGPEEAKYMLEYRVGEGSYFLEGTMAIRGTSSQYGPFTDEMWNMLALYNPWSFRVMVQGQNELSSEWVHFTIVPTRDAVPIGRWGLVKVAAVFWWAEMGLLASGLALALVDLLRLVSGIPLVDVVSGALLLAIVVGILKAPLMRLGVERVKLWGFVVLYTVFIYATLPVMPKAWRALWAYTQGRIDFAGWIVTVAVLIAMFAYLVARCRKLLPFVGFIGLMGVYGWMLANLGTSPAERFHLAEYGVLGFFTLRALRIDVAPVPAFALAWGITMILGAGDEAIQWLLPSRVFEWKDVGLNVVSSGLGLAAVGLLKAGRS
ncbi:MAG: VanZ family protein [Candidatus Latescibacteria bacterium]|nr:VanZ family protein [Candidatus Latescibacterota bacterium]